MQCWLVCDNKARLTSVNAYAELDLAVVDVRELNVGAAGKQVKGHVGHF